ncbi:MAG: hypothetical protein AB7H88_05660 [Vicinamibacterales bacterium]
MADRYGLARLVEELAAHVAVPPWVWMAVPEAEFGWRDGGEASPGLPPEEVE